MNPTTLTRAPSAGSGTRPAAGRRATPPRPGWLLAIVLTGQFMALLDAFIVNVAAPTIRSDLHASGAGLQLVVAGYTIAYAVLLITGARLGDRFGHRAAFLGGLAVFTGASLACGLAAGTGQLIAFRLVQGAGSALMLPQVLSLIQRTYQGARRARALSAFSAVIASGAVVGQVAGGLLVDADLFGTGWRPVFLVNVPIGVALLAAGPRLIPRDRRGRDRAPRPLDVPGLLTLGAAVTTLTVPLVLGREYGWPAWTWGSLAVSAVCFGAFAVAETRLARRGGAPLISGRVLRAPGMPVAVARIGLTMAANAAFLLTFALHFQGGLGYRPAHAGLLFAPTAVAFGAFSLNWGRLPGRWHPWLAPAGALAAAVACLLSGFALRGGGGGGPLLHGALVLLGLGMGGAYSPTLTRALATVRTEDAADASGLLVTVTQLGQLIGVATFGSLYLELAPGTGTHGAAAGSAHALAVTTVALAVVLAAVAAAGTGRRRR
ncbi:MULTISPECIES: MFS transporter [Streptomycetaceae]|nr:MULTISPECIES: MFS transporter [Streptomycetaceae]MYS58667.1 MFS transporter [Streptomyces sp. SID5468]CCB74338.1 putative transmembrane transport protein [Streptantibioticus cattleyicolor NRRL 8057 = DSM 46488]